MTNLRFLVKPTALCALLLSLVSCGSSQTYSSIEPGAAPARARSSLEIPPDLIATSSSNLVKNSQTQPTAKSVTVLPKPSSANITRNDEEGWLQVDMPADKVWKRLTDYWASLGVDLVVSDPKSGIMETDWVMPPGGADKLHNGIFDKLLGRLGDAPTELNKFTIRLERKGDSATRVYVTEKGVKKIEDEKGGFATFQHWSWVATKQNPNAVRLALSSIEYSLQHPGQAGAASQEQSTLPNVNAQGRLPPPTPEEHGLDYNPPIMR